MALNRLTLKRIVRAGLLNFWRNAFVSLASILVMTVTLFVVGTTVFAGVILGATIEELRDKADVNVYFVTSAPEEEILELSRSLSTLPEVEGVENVSREQALPEF